MVLERKKSRYSCVSWLSSDIAVIAESIHVLPCKARATCRQATRRVPPRMSLSQSPKSSGAIEHWICIIDVKYTTGPLSQDLRRTRSQPCRIRDTILTLRDRQRKIYVVDQHRCHNQMTVVVPPGALTNIDACPQRLAHAPLPAQITRSAL